MAEPSDGTRPRFQEGSPPSDTNVTSRDIVDTPNPQGRGVFRFGSVADR